MIQRGIIYPQFVVQPVGTFEAYAYTLYTGLNDMTKEEYASFLDKAQFVVRNMTGHELNYVEASETEADPGTVIELYFTKRLIEREEQSNV